MIPRAHQLEQAKLGLAVLKKHGLVYLNAEERTGKTLTALLIAESLGVSKVLVLTKKKALDGWLKPVQWFSNKMSTHFTNYHQAKNLSSNYELVILDEAHCYLSGYPKKSKMWESVKKLTKEKPVIYISATPHAQGYQLLYHQLALSSWSPWRLYKTFYSWFRTFGVEKYIYLSGRKIQQYTETKKDKVEESVEHLFVGITRKELKFRHEPVDILHYISLSNHTKGLYNEMLNCKVLKLAGHDLILDTPMKLRTSLHMLEGGVAKNTVFGEVQCSTRLVKTSGEHAYYLLGNIEKVEFILSKWGDSKDIAIMYNYIAEGILLNRHFAKAMILQGTSNAEGIDLSSIKTLIIYSQDFSTSRHTQRRARQANKNRLMPIEVHYLLVKDAVSAQVYKTVSENKANFVDSSFKRNLL